MKKLSIIFIIIIVTIIGLSFASDYYRADLYETAIDFSASDAGLQHRVGKFEPTSGRPNETSFSYFEGPKVTGQETIVLLHGFSASKESWLRYSKYLTKKLHVVALDLSGHGENIPDLQQKYGVADQVEFVMRAMKQLGIQRFHLVGNSMGGAISVLYAATYPDQVLSATLISPAGVHDIPSQMDGILAEGGNPLIVTSADAFSALLDFTMEDPPYMPDALIKYQGEVAAARFDINTKIFADLQADLQKGSEMEERIHKVQTPVLFLWGDHDRAINVKNIDKYSNLIPNSQKRILKNIGHLAMLEVPEVAAQATLKFLMSTRSRTQEYEK